MQHSGNSQFEHGVNRGPVRRRTEAVGGGSFCRAGRAEAGLPKADR